LFISKEREGKKGGEKGFRRLQENSLQRRDGKEKNCALFVNREEQTEEEGKKEREGRIILAHSKKQADERTARSPREKKGKKDSGNSVGKERDFSWGRE